ncbi:MAG: sensor histidine kinase [Spirochaetota bacterium]
MRTGLTLRVALSHLALVIVALGIFLVVLSVLTRGSFVAAEARVDRAMAQRLAPWLDEYHSRRGSWQGIEDAVAQAAPPMTGGGPRMTDRPFVRRAMPMTDMTLAQPILLLDASGNFVASSRAPGVPRGRSADPLPDPRLGEPVGPPANPSGWLFVGSMIPGVGTPLQAALSATIVRASAISGVAVLLLAALAAAYWSSWLLRPLRALEDASGRLARGDYTVRVAPPRGEHELRSLAESFNAMATEIGAQEATRRRFVADAAHELRTPLSLLSARIEMLSEGVYDPSPEQWESLRGGVGRLVGLVDDLQVLARLDAGRVELERKPVQTDAFLAQVVAEFHPIAERAGVTLVQQGTGERVPSVYADPARLHQILSNLLANAVRHTPEGGRVTLAARARSGSAIAGVEPSPRSPAVGQATVAQRARVEIIVEDTGPGIPLEARERVFERFIRLDTDRGRAGGGSGLGLSIARRLAELHDGTITAESPELGPSGARLVVALPASSS